MAFDVTVNRNIELVQTIIYLAGGSPTQCLKNAAYCSALDEWFSKLAEHEAVAYTREMILRDHFTYGRPHMAALRLDELLADDTERYHDWALMVERFADESRFDAFFEKEKPYYNSIVERVNETDFTEWIDWTDKFWSCAHAPTFQVICILDGNYGFSLKRKGRNENFIIRCLPAFNADGEEFWSAGRLANGIVHEYAHTYVNPVVEAHKKVLAKYPDFFGAHTNMMTSYNVDYAVINEYLVRAFTILFLERYRFEDVTAVAETERHKKNFPFIEDFIELLKEFDGDKNGFEAFYLTKIDEILSKKR